MLAAHALYPNVTSPALVLAFPQLLAVAPSTLRTDPCTRPSVDPLYSPLPLPVAPIPFLISLRARSAPPPLPRSLGLLQLVPHQARAQLPPVQVGRQPRHRSSVCDTAPRLVLRQAAGQELLQKV